MSLTYKHPIIPSAYMLESMHIIPDWDGFVQTFHPNCMPQSVAEAIHKAEIYRIAKGPVPADYIIRRADDCPF